MMYKIFLFMFSASLLFAQDAGKTGFAALKLPVGARNAALGNIGVTSAADVTALYYNPAMLNINAGSEVFIYHNQWIQDASSEYFGARTSFWGTSWAAGLSTSKISDIEIRKIAGEAEGTFNAHNMTALIAGAFSPAENWQAGITFKYLYEEYFVDQAEGFAFDLGAAYLSSPDGYRFSAAFKNLGSMNNLRNEATKLPLEFRAGVYKQFRQVFAQIDIAGGFEIQQGITSGDLKLNAGAEIVYDNLLAMRLGVTPFNETNYISAGLGIYYSSMVFDYAFTPFSEDLGSGHMVSINYLF